MQLRVDFLRRRVWGRDDRGYSCEFQILYPTVDPACYRRNSGTGHSTPRSLARALEDGKRFCTAGVGDYGCISAFVNWVHIEGDEGEPALPVQPGDVLLNVSGFDANQTPVHWGDIAHHLKVGDQVCIEIMDINTADRPRITEMLPEYSPGDAAGDGSPTSR